MKTYRFFVVCFGVSSFEYQIRIKESKRLNSFNYLVCRKIIPAVNCVFTKGSEVEIQCYCNNTLETCFKYKVGS